MATLVLQAAGQAVGGLFGPVGAIVGRAAGALAGNILDQRLFGESSTREVGRIDDVSVQTGSEGNPVPRVYGPSSRSVLRQAAVSSASTRPASS